MGRISMTALRPGMVLAEEVRDRNGRLLLDEGQIISERHLRILKIWSVVEVSVRGVDEESQPRDGAVEIEDRKLWEAVQEYQAARFAFNDLSHPVCKALFEHCVERHVEACLRQHVPYHVVQGRSLTLKAHHCDAGDPTPPDKPSRRQSPEELLRLDEGLGTLPMVFHKLVAVVNDPGSSALDAAEVISYDPQLAAKLLRIVNSTFYGMRMEVESVSRAVAIIGGNQLLSLAMGLSVVSAFKGIPSEMVDMEAFWKHSVACGIAARLMAGFRKVPNTERFFVSGLLHDVGRLAFFAQQPERARKMLENTRGLGRLLVDQENLELGLNHSILGRVLLENWKLPFSLENNVGYHHDFERSPNRQDAALLQLADVLANALECGTSGERYVPRVSAELWDAVGVPVGALVQILIQVDLQLDDILRFFIDG